MKLISDLKVNKADDIIISNDDISIEPNSIFSVVRNAQRRLVARYDDFSNNPSICAGLEQYGQKPINAFLISDIETSVNIALTNNYLLQSNDYKLYLQQEDDNIRAFFVLSIPNLNMEDIPPELYFNVLINKNNQRTFR